MIASELKIGDTFKKQGFKFTVKKINQDNFKNGTPCILVECTINDGVDIDSFFVFKLTTKIR